MLMSLKARGLLTKRWNRVDSGAAQAHLEVQVRPREGVEGARAGDAVGHQVRPALELDQGALGVNAEAAVDVGARKAVPRKRELKLGDVPAGIAGRETPGPQDVPREAAQGAAGL